MSNFPPSSNLSNVNPCAHLDGSLLVRAFLRILAIDWLGCRLLYWFQNCSEEQGVEGPLESEEVEEGVEEAEETEEARDLGRSG